MNEFKYYKEFQLFNMHVSNSTSILSALVLHTSIMWRLSPRCMPIVLTILIVLKAAGITLEMLKDLHSGREKSLEGQNAKAYRVLSILNFQTPCSCHEAQEHDVICNTELPIKNMKARVDLHCIQIHTGPKPLMF